VGLEKNAAGICDGPAYRDPALVSCATNVECAAGTACFPQSRTHLFSDMAPTAESADTIATKKQLLGAQLAEVSEVRKDGLSCVHARDCGSYSCVGGTRQERKVCWFAAAGEMAGATVKCGGGLIKNASGVCEAPPAVKNTVYLGLIEETVIAPIGKCEFRLDDDTRAKSVVAMQSLRAIEYFLSTVTVEPGVSAGRTGASSGPSDSGARRSGVSGFP
jgi:hypothetical protein